MRGGKRSYESSVAIAVVALLFLFGLLYGLRAIDDAKILGTRQTLRGIGKVIENSSIQGRGSWATAEIANVLGWKLCGENKIGSCVSATRMKWKGIAGWRMCTKDSCYYMKEDGRQIWASRVNLGKAVYIGKGVRGAETMAFTYTWSK